MHESVKAALDNFDGILALYGDASHHGHDEDYRRLARIFISAYQQNVFPHPDDVKHWALDRGWSEDAAHDLQEFSEVVRYTLQELGAH